MTWKHVNSNHGVLVSDRRFAESDRRFDSISSVKCPISSPTGEITDIPPHGCFYYLVTPVYSICNAGSTENWDLTEIQSDYSWMSKLMFTNTVEQHIPLLHHMHRYSDHRPSRFSLFPLPIFNYRASSQPPLHCTRTEPNTSVMQQQ